jgi:hypothetical protein
VDSRKLKRKARSRAYWLGHTMSRFNGNTSECKICHMTMTITEDEIRGDAIQRACTQQLMFTENGDADKNGSGDGDKVRQ